LRCGSSAGMSDSGLIMLRLLRLVVGQVDKPLGLPGY
jgi:hypothetical protein